MNRPYLSLSPSAMLVTLRQLQYIIAVADTGSFSKAADLCSAEQSTVSQQVKAMEDRLGKALFDRSKQPIVATEEGLIVVSQAREIVEKVEDMLRPFRKNPGA
ncbi:MAG: LysR family transcriptional regulator [Bacteroidia bacterium]